MDEDELANIADEGEESEESKEAAEAGRRERLGRWVEELSPEDKQKLLDTAKQASEALAARVDMSGILRALEVQRSSINAALGPLLRAQRVWQRQLAQSISSDALKALAPMQEQMRQMTAILARNVDFGALGQYAKLNEQFRAQQATWFKDIVPQLARLKNAFWPPNLRGIEDLDLEEVEAVVMLDGIGLYGVPRRSTAEALIKADSATQRREILGRRWKTIAADCREAMGTCESEAIATYATIAVAAIDALEAGHTQAAQALVGSLIDSILIAYLGNKRYLYTPNNKTKNSDAYKEFGIRKFIALAPMWQAYQQFWARSGDAVPTTFNRNATAHTVSGRQFNRRNAVQGLLFACGLITFLEEQARREGA